MPSPFARVLAACERALFHRSTLEPLIEAAGLRTTPFRFDRAEARSHTALESSAQPLTFRVPRRRHARLTVPFAVSGVNHASGRVKLIVSIADGGRVLQRREALVGPNSPATWREIALPLPAPPGPSVQVTLTATAASSAAPRVVWGMPGLRWRKTKRELRRSARLAVTEYGLAGTLQRLRDRTAIPPVDPQAYADWLRTKADERAKAAAAAAATDVRFTFFIAATTIDGLAATLASLSEQAGVFDVWVWSAALPAEEVLACAARSAPSLTIRTAPPGTDEAAARNTALETFPDAMFIALEGGDVIPAFALPAMAAAARDAEVVYADDDCPGNGRGRQPHFKPEWSPEYLWSRMYVGRMVAVRSRIARAAGGYDRRFQGALDYHLLLRLSHRSPAVRHVADVLCHRGSSEFASWRADAERAALIDAAAAGGREVEEVSEGTRGTWRVRSTIAGRPRISIVVPTDGRRAEGATEPFLLQCVASLREFTGDAAWNLVIVDNGRLDPASEARLRDVPHRRATYRWEGPFNFARKINFAVAQSDGEYVLLLNDDIEAIHEGWLSAMLEYAQQDAVGAVGAKLFYPDGRLQHVGVATGVCGIAAHLLHQYPAGSRGCDDAAVTVRNWSAVTGACLLTRRSVYEAIGGFDERLLIDFNDVDFCLRVRASGRRVVFTPHARLYHHESATFGPRRQRAGDVEMMRQIWGDALERDPYYNPNLRRDVPDCRPVFVR